MRESKKYIVTTCSLTSILQAKHMQKNTNTCNVGMQRAMSMYFILAALLLQLMPQSHFPAKNSSFPPMNSSLQGQNLVPPGLPWPPMRIPPSPPGYGVRCRCEAGSTCCTIDSKCPALLSASLVPSFFGLDTRYWVRI